MTDATPARLVIYSHSAELAGAERALVTIVRELTRRGIAILVVVPRNGPLVEQLQRAGATVSRARLPLWLARRMPWPVFIARAAAALLSLPRLVLITRRFRPTHAYTNSLVIPEGALTARLLRIRHVWHVREYVAGNETLKTKLPIDYIYSCVQRWSDQVFAVSNDVASQLPEAARGVTVVHAGSAPDRFTGTSPAPHAWLAAGSPGLALIGTQSVAKGSFLAVDVLARVRAILPEARLLLVGPALPATRRALLRLIAERSLGEAVQVEDFVDDIRGVLAAADVCLIASLHEAYGLITLEALAAGVPVVGSDSGGTRDLLSDGSGLLVPPGDAQAFADAVIRVATEPGLADRLRRGGPDRARSFDPAAEAAALLAYLAQGR
ncbi:MAG: glycosyltransferase family 4 protein [Mycobacteriales bacterium]